MLAMFVEHATEIIIGLGVLVFLSMPPVTQDDDLSEG